jgi:DNA-binding MarR family transcriptional regulator
MQQTSAHKKETHKSPRGRPVLNKGELGGPLSRELVTVKVARLGDFIVRSASLAFPRASGFSDFEWRVLARVCETPRLSINDLSQLLHRGVAQVSRTVKKLVSAGLLHRASRGGGPGVLITPTPVGRTVYGPLVELARQRNSAIVKGLSEEDLKVLDHCLAVMTDNTLEELAREQELQGPRRR